MVTPLVTSLLHFQKYNLFKNMVCILALFGLFGLLFQKMGNFLPNHQVTLSTNVRPTQRLVDKTVEWLAKLF